MLWSEREGYGRPRNKQKWIDETVVIEGGYSFVCLSKFGKHWIFLGFTGIDSIVLLSNEAHGLGWSAISHNKEAENQQEPACEYDTHRRPGI
jgi:hypothetical protein